MNMIHQDGRGNNPQSQVNSDTRELLRELHAHNPWAYLWTDYTDDEEFHGTSLWYRVQDGPPEPPAAWGNVYFSVHGCHERGGMRQRGGRDGWRLGYANCLYADFDAKVYGSVDAILTHLDDLWRADILYPTALVASGGGVHCYWLFEQPVNLRKPAHRARLELVQQVWVDAVVRADSAAKDMARVLRLPGTFNHKYSPPRPVELIEFNRKQIFPLSVVADVVWPYVELHEEQQRIRQERAAALAGKDSSWVRLYRAAERLAYKGTRHNLTLWLAHKLREEGCPEILAAELINEFVQAHITDRPTGREAEGIVRHAYQ
ncbi:MAG: hypothetical protein QM346_08895 [Chloroflexota bacterium]|nr:hypothetical protein [Chloroflexota bacterium]